MTNSRPSNLAVLAVERSLATMIGLQRVVDMLDAAHDNQCIRLLICMYYQIHHSFLLSRTVVRTEMGGMLPLRHLVHIACVFFMFYGLHIVNSGHD